MKKMARAHAVAGAIFFAAVAYAEASSAYCRSRTVRDAACDKFDDAGCRSCGLPLFWRSRCVGFSLQQDASKQISYDHASLAVARAFARWSTASCAGGFASIDGRNLGPVPCGDVHFNRTGPNQNTIAFRDGVWRPDDTTASTAGGGLRGETIALTTTSYSTRTGELVGADMEINSGQFKFTATGNPAPDTFDLESVLTHEVGHFLGLAHTAERAAVMYAGGETGRTLQRELKSDDLAAICEAFPADGNRPVDGAADPSGWLVSTACDPAPARGLATQCAAPSAASGCQVAHRSASPWSPLLAALMALGTVAATLRRLGRMPRFGRLRRLRRLRRRGRLGRMPRLRRLGRPARLAGPSTGPRINDYAAKKTR